MCMIDQIIAYNKEFVEQKGYGGFIIDSETGALEEIMEQRK